MILAALSIAAFWLALVASFVAVMHGKRLIEDGGLSLFWRANLWPLAVIAFALDFVFDLVFGHLMFLDLRWHTLFSNRVQWHYRRSGGWRFRLAVWWAKNLNQVDPGHIR